MFIFLQKFNRLVFIKKKYCVLCVEENGFFYITEINCRLQTVEKANKVQLSTEFLY